VSNVDDAPELMKAAEVAAMFRVSIDTVYHWANTQGLPHRRYSPRTIRFPRAEVIAWDEARRTAVGEPATPKATVEQVAPPVAIPGWDGVRRSKAKLI
jgi:predicted DNA-binding transcriptional regulator AlpA